MVLGAIKWLAILGDIDPQGSLSAYRAATSYDESNYVRWNGWRREVNIQPGHVG